MSSQILEHECTFNKEKVLSEYCAPRNFIETFNGSPTSAPPSVECRVQSVLSRHNIRLLGAGARAPIARKYQRPSDRPGKLSRQQVWTLELQKKVREYFISTKKAPIKAFSQLTPATIAFAFKSMLRHYAKQVLTCFSVIEKSSRTFV